MRRGLWPIARQDAYNWSIRPEEAFARILELFRDEEWLPDIGIGSGAVIEPGAVLGEGVRIGANCHVGGGAELGDGCVLFPNVFVGERVRIGSESRLYPGATVYSGCSLGTWSDAACRGCHRADGFGYRPGPVDL